MKERLSKYLAKAGVSSRRGSEKLIFGGWILVNGKKVTTPQHLVSSEDEIQVKGEVLNIQKSPHIYFMMNKPKGYVCSNKKIGSKKVIYDLLDKRLPRLFSVGRLDKDTTGLIILTNDGNFAQNLAHPSKKVKKEYLVKTNKEITPAHLKAISNGCEVEGKWVTPFSVKKVRRGTLKVIVTDGRKHEVRLLVKNADLTVLELKRIRIGALCLGSLQEGSYRHLCENEVDQLFA